MEPTPSVEKVRYRRRRYPVPSSKLQTKGRLLVVAFIAVSVLVVFFASSVFLISLGDLANRHEKLLAISLRAAHGNLDDSVDVAICRSPDCRAEEEALSQDVDETKPACHDFYAHACSRWTRRNLPSRHQAENARADTVRARYVFQLYDSYKAMAIDSALQTAEEKAAAMFTGCMDRDSIEELGAAPLKALLVKLGVSFPPKGDEARRLDLSRLVAMSLRTLGVQSFLSAQLRPDVQLKEQAVCALGAPDIFLETPLLEDNVIRLSWYQGLMAKAFFYLVEDENYASRLAEDTFNLENDIALAKIADIPPEADPLYERVIVKNLVQLPQWSWTGFLSTLFGVKQSSLGEDVYVLVRSMDFLHHLAPVFGNSSRASLATLVAWRVLVSVSPLLPRPLDELSRLHAQGDPVLACYALLEPALGATFANTLLRRQPPVNMQKVKTLLHQIQDGIVEMLKNSPAISQEMNTIVGEKIRDMKWHIFPRPMEGVRDMDSIFEKARDISSSRVLDGFFTLSSLAMESRWLPSSPTLQRPIYVARFGFAAARQLLQAVLPQGWLVDSSGRFRAWWSESARSVYDKRTFCLVKQYAEHSWLPMNTTASLHENVLDNVAVQVVHAVYTSILKHNRPPFVGREAQWHFGDNNMTAEQLFFYAYASNMCSALSSRADYERRMRGPIAPASFRVNIPLQNLRAFAEAFECDDKAKMNPERRCIIW
ncbi:endothelin-converting enzyme 1-like isoform X2 [Dermacentor albipictus]|uniref:endothelin-converting enzyme 1-like isoform X2 n=1 Tax=Dermacentor albipictus TaxID=60249 RepID=UPI0038FC3E9F